MSEDQKLETKAEARPSDLTGKAVLAGGAGAGVAIVLALIQQPQMVKELAALLYGWGPLALIAVVGMVFANQRAVQVVSTLERNAAAQQALALAVQEIARKDDRNEQERTLRLDMISYKLGVVLEKLDHIEVSDLRKGAASGSR